MDRCTVRIKAEKGAKIPVYSSSEAAGCDLFALLGEPLVIKCGKRAMVPTGISISLPRGYEAQVRPRSGLAAKAGITVLNSPGTIDSDYRGEIKVILINLGEEDFTINSGDRIAQMVITKHSCAEFAQVDVLDDTARGEGGFGSTGVR